MARSGCGPRPVSHAELRHLGLVHRHTCRKQTRSREVSFLYTAVHIDAYPDPKQAKNHCSGTVCVEFGQREAVTQENIHPFFDWEAGGEIHVVSIFSSRVF